MQNQRGRTHTLCNIKKRCKNSATGTLELAGDYLHWLILLQKADLPLWGCTLHFSSNWDEQPPPSPPPQPLSKYKLQGHGIPDKRCSWRTFLFLKRPNCLSVSSHTFCGLYYILKNLKSDKISSPTKFSRSQTKQ